MRRWCWSCVTDAAARCSPHARSVLDIGCGAGNYTLRLLEKTGPLDVTLVDLSLPMLERARSGIAQRPHSQAGCPAERHSRLRLSGRLAGYCHGGGRAPSSSQRPRMGGGLSQVWAVLRPGGCFWIADLVSHDDPRIQQLMWDRYGQYLVALKGEAYRDQVFEYVEREDTPRSVAYQLQLLTQTGFMPIEVLHKNGCFAAFGGIKPAEVSPAASGCR